MWWSPNKFLASPGMNFELADSPYTGSLMNSSTFCHSMRRMIRWLRLTLVSRHYAEFECKVNIVCNESSYDAGVGDVASSFLFGKDHLEEKMN